MSQGPRAANTPSDPHVGPPPGEPHSAAILFDVADLDRSCAFYSSTLGFRAVGSDRVGLPFESRTLRSERYPALALTVRQTYRRPVIGSAPGGIIHIALREPRLAEVARSLEGRVTWSEPPGENPDACRAIELIDPDGYLIRLFT